MKTQIALMNVKHTQKNNNLISFCLINFNWGETKNSSGDPTTVAYACSVDGEDITLDLMAQLGLEVTQLLLQHCQCRHDDGLWSQGAA